MAYPAKKKSEYTFVRGIYGKGDDAKERYNYIPEGGMNDVIKAWQAAQPEHPRDKASPSTLVTCPRVVWLQNKGVEPTNEMTWAVKQRMLLGRLFENQFAVQLDDQGMLLKHWKDDPGQEVDKFRLGEGDEELTGVPDYLLSLPHDGGNVIPVSDAKTIRSDGLGYVPLDDKEIFNEWSWYRYRIQLTAYYMLCRANKEWFEIYKLPLPTHCHLFAYALDDGVVRREILWRPTKEDADKVRSYTVRYNQAVKSPTMPPCTCQESTDNFDVKFCAYGVKEEGQKVADKCCSNDLVKKVKE